MVVIVVLATLTRFVEFWNERTVQVVVVSSGATLDACVFSAEQSESAAAAADCSASCAQQQALRAGQSRRERLAATVACAGETGRWPPVRIGGRSLARTFHPELPRQPFEGAPSSARQGGAGVIQHYRPTLQFRFRFFGPLGPAKRRAGRLPNVEEPCQIGKAHVIQLVLTGPQLAGWSSLSPTFNYVLPPVACGHRATAARNQNTT